MDTQWKKIPMKDVCKTNMNSYSLSESWKFINYLDTGNITQGKIDNIQHIVCGKDNIPSRARRKFIKDSAQKTR
jgi:type I restriction enzyme S subunit